MKFLRPGDVWYFSFPVQGSTGAATSADSAPTMTISKNGVIDAAPSISLSAVATGKYNGSVTLPTTYSHRDQLVLHATVTMNGIVGPPTPVAVATVRCDDAVQDAATAQGGAANSITLQSGASAVDNFYRGSIVFIYAGTGAGQSPRVITGYVGSTKIASVGRSWAVNPDNTSQYVVLATANPRVDDSLRVDVGSVAGTTQTARDLGATLGEAGAGLTALGDTRIAYLDSSVSGVLAAVQNVQNNTFLSTNIPATLERPDAGSTTFQIVLAVANETGAATDIDAAALPTVALADNSGTDRSGRLSVWAHPATGKYTATYTNTSTDAIDDLHWEITATVNTKLRRYVATTQLVDTTAIDFTATDRSNLTAIFGKLPTNAIADEMLLEARLPAALVGGRMDSSVGAMATDVLTAAALNGDAVTEMQAGLAQQSTVSATQTTVGTMNTNVTGLVASMARVLGLSQDNNVVDTFVYDANGNMTSCAVWIYDTAAHATTNDHATGLVGSYTVNGTFVSNALTLIKQLRAS